MEKLLKELNVFLADSNVLYRKVQNYHWNITGPRFFTLHAKLEEYYDGINGQIDEVAEKLLMLGAQPLGTMKDYLDVTSIKEAKNEKISCSDVIKNVLADFTFMLNSAAKLKKDADAADCYLVSAYMDEVIAEYSKAVWMLNQSQDL